MQKVTTCPICESTKLSVLTNLSYNKPNEFNPIASDAIKTRLWILFNKIIPNKNQETFASTFCNSCGFIFTNPRFTEEDIITKYNTINELGTVKKRLQENPPTNLDQRAKRIHQLINKFVKPTPDKRLSILDYGAASGYNLEPFKKDFDCYVLDYEKWDLPESVQYVGKDLDDLKKDQKFDIVFLLHTLEHVIKPTEMVTKISQHLKPNGIFYIEVPLGCFREWRFLPEPLTHVNFFSEQSLSNCLQAAGLNTLHLSTKYQWVTHQNLWCLNIIGTNSSSIPKKITPLSTKKQMSYYRYFAPFLLKRDPYKKALGRFKQNLQKSAITQK